MGIPGSPISHEVKKTVVTLKEYFDRTRRDEKESHASSVIRVANALDIGVATVKRVMAEFNKNPNFQDETSEPSQRGRPPKVISDSFESKVRTYIRSANQEGRYITLEMVFNYLQPQIHDDKFSVRTLGRALDRWGFTFGRGTRSQHLKEKDYVIAARQRYLREKLGNRSDDSFHRPEVYLDESYVNKNHSNDFIWYFEDDGPWVQKPTGKGERLIIINAMIQDGWLPGAQLVFKSTRKTGDYHGQMNNGLFTKWFTEKLLPNLPKNSLIIMDNASYHNVLAEHSPPTTNSKKEKIVEWLRKQGIPLQGDCLKAEMVEILAKFAIKPIYMLDVLAEKHGHQILRTPPYHPELQPIETCWAVVKNHIARTSNMTMIHLQEQLESGFAKVTAKTCSGLIKKIQQVEDKFWKEDVKLDS